MIPQQPARHEISIHAPREGSDRICSPIFADASNFYPRSPRGERPGGYLYSDREQLISIHAPREGSD